MAGTLHFWKGSSLVGSLVGGLFSFSKEKAIYQDRRENASVTHCIRSRRPEEIRVEGRSTGHTLLNGKEGTSQVRNQTKMDVGKGRKEQPVTAPEECGFVTQKHLPPPLGAASSVPQNVIRE